MYLHYIYQIQTMDTSSKRQRFEKVAGNRVQKVIDFLNLL